MSILLPVQWKDVIAIEFDGEGLEQGSRGHDQGIKFNVHSWKV